MLMNITLEKENVESFLRRHGDDKVWAERMKRRLTEEEREWMDGPIHKLEIKTQLQHMKPNSAPIIDGLTVQWHG